MLRNESAMRSESDAHAFLSVALPGRIIHSRRAERIRRGPCCHQLPLVFLLPAPFSLPPLPLINCCTGRSCIFRSSLFSSAEVVTSLSPPSSPCPLRSVSGHSAAAGRPRQVEAEAALAAADRPLLSSHLFAWSVVRRSGQANGERTKPICAPFAQSAF